MFRPQYLDSNPDIMASSPRNHNQSSFNCSQYWVHQSQGNSSDAEEINEYLTENASYSESSHDSSYDQKGLLIAVSSNLAFFVGSVCYCLTSYWDWIWYIKTQYYDDDYYDYNADTITFTLDAYSYVSIFGAILMIFNAAFDFYRYIHRFGNKSTGSLLNNFVSSDLLAAFSFGIAASIDLIVTFLTGDVVRLVNVASIVSAHIYLLSAIFSLYGQPLFDFTLSEGRLCLIGDWLFLIGSLIDVLISYFSDRDIIKINGGALNGMNIFSSVLWVTDAGEIELAHVTTTSLMRLFSTSISNLSSTNITIWSNHWNSALSR